MHSSNISVSARSRSFAAIRAALLLSFSSRSSCASSHDDASINEWHGVVGSAGALIGWLNACVCTGWTARWLAGQPHGWLASRLVGWLAAWLADCLTAKSVRRSVSQQTDHTVGWLLGRLVELANLDGWMACCLSDWTGLRIAGAGPPNGAWAGCFIPDSWADPLDCNCRPQTSLSPPLPAPSLPSAGASSPTHPAPPPMKAWAITLVIVLVSGLAR